MVAQETGETRTDAGGCDRILDTGSHDLSATIPTTVHADLTVPGSQCQPLCSLFLAGGGQVEGPIAE